MLDSMLRGDLPIITLDGVHNQLGLKTQQIVNMGLMVIAMHHL